MNRDDEKRIAAIIAKTLAMMCVRNTGLETLHAGVVPVTHTGDYSDVRVIDADGREIAWNDEQHRHRDKVAASGAEISCKQFVLDLGAQRIGQIVAEGPIRVPRAGLVDHAPDGRHLFAKSCRGPSHSLGLGRQLIELPNDGRRVGVTTD